MVRLKNRYMVARIILENRNEENPSLSDSIISKVILENVEKYYGLFGLASVEQGFRVKYCNEKTRIVIIRTRHGPHRFVSSMLPLITVIGNNCTKFLLLYTGATIMQCNKFIVKYQLNFLHKTFDSIESKKERNDFIKNVINFEIE